MGYPAGEDRRKRDLLLSREEFVVEDVLEIGRDRLVFAGHDLALDVVEVEHPYPGLGVPRDPRGPVAALDDVLDLPALLDAERREVDGYGVDEVRGGPERGDLVDLGVELQRVEVVLPALADLVGRDVPVARGHVPVEVDQDDRHLLCRKLRGDAPDRLGLAGPRAAEDDHVAVVELPRRPVDPPPVRGMAEEDIKSVGTVNDWRNATGRRGGSMSTVRCELRRSTGAEFEHRRCEWCRFRGGPEYGGRRGCDEPAERGRRRERELFLLFFRLLLLVGEDDLVPPDLFLLRLLFNRRQGRHGRGLLRDGSGPSMERRERLRRRGRPVDDDLRGNLGHQGPPEVPEERIIEVPVLDDEPGEVDPVVLRHLLEDIDRIGELHEHP